MRKVLLFILILIQICHGWLLLPTTSVRALPTNLPSSTNQLKIELRTAAESLADLEYYVTLPSGSQQYIFATNTGHGQRTQMLELGKHSDEADPQCVRVENTRRTGICEDGHYLVEVVATDAAGNRSSVATHGIERDTVRPAISHMGELTLCGNDICVEIAGELAAGIYANGRYLQSLNDSGQVRIHSGWRYDTHYRFDIHLRDAAGNHSDTYTRELRTSVLAVGDADPYAGKESKNLPPGELRVDIKYGEGYEISRIKIPAPELTAIETSVQSVVSTYGVGISRDHSLKVEINTQYLTFAEAAQKCDAPSSIAFMSSSERSCMQEHMGVDSVWDWHWETLAECGYAIPVYTTLCMENKKKSKFVSRYKDKIIEKVDHVMTALYKHDAQFLGSFWSDTVDGRFRFDRSLGADLAVGDQVKSRSVIFGDFEYEGMKIDYRGVDSESAAANQGLASSFSNTLQVPEPRDFINSVINPLIDPSCDGATFTSKYGEREIFGKRSFHDAVDLAKPRGCKISAVYSGNRVNTTGYGNTVKIVHDDFAFTTLYGHGAYYIGGNGHVETGENIMYMGNTGVSTGVHLHFIVREGCSSYGCHVDPVIYFRKYLEKMPGYYE